MARHQASASGHTHEAEADEDVHPTQPFMQVVEQAVPANQRTVVDVPSAGVDSTIEGTPRVCRRVDGHVRRRCSIAREGKLTRRHNEQAVESIRVGGQGIKCVWVARNVCVHRKEHSYARRTTTALQNRCALCVIFSPTVHPSTRPGHHPPPTPTHTNHPSIPKPAHTQHTHSTLVQS